MMTNLHLPKDILFQFGDDILALSCSMFILIYENRSLWKRTKSKHWNRVSQFMMLLRLWKEFNSKIPWMPEVLLAQFLMSSNEAKRSISVWRELEKTMVSRVIQQVFCLAKRLPRSSAIVIWSELIEAWPFCRPVQSLKENDEECLLRSISAALLNLIIEIVEPFIIEIVQLFSVSSGRYSVCILLSSMNHRTR